MSEVVREPQSRGVIKFHDCDPFGHLAHVRYAEYLVSARDEHVAQYYPLLQSAIASSERNWVVTHSELVFLSPARAREQVKLVSCIVKACRTSGKLELVMGGEDDSALKAIMWIDLLYVDLRTGKCVAHSDELMKCFSSLVVPGVETQDLYKRVRQRIGDARM